MELINTPQVHLEECEKTAQRLILGSVFYDWGKGAFAVVKEAEQHKCKFTCEAKLESPWLRIVVNGTLSRFFSA